MKTLLLALFLISPLANAKTTLVIGQSNAWGIVQYGGLHGKVIDCTHPGQFIAPFLPGDAFFNDCMKKAKGKTIDSVIFWQGESDASEQLTAQTWKAKALILLRTLRKTVCNDKTKLVVVALHDETYEIPSTNPYWLDIRAQQQSLKGAIHIDSSNYEFLNQGDNWANAYVHLSNEGYQNITKDIERLLNK